MAVMWLVLRSTSFQELGLGAEKSADNECKTWYPLPSQAALTSSSLLPRPLGTWLTVGSAHQHCGSLINMQEGILGLGTMGCSGCQESRPVQLSQ